MWLLHTTSSSLKMLDLILCPIGASGHHLLLSRRSLIVRPLKRHLGLMEEITWQSIALFIIGFGSELVAVDEGGWPVAIVWRWHSDVVGWVSVAVVVLEKQVRRIILRKHGAIHHNLIVLFDVGNARA